VGCSGIHTWAAEVILTGFILVQQWHVIYKSMVEDSDNICISTTNIFLEVL